MLNQTLLCLLGEEPRPPSPTIDTRHVYLPSDWSGRYSPGIRIFLPSLSAPTGFITLKKDFHKELQTESICPKRYLATAERENFRIFCKNGLFYDKRGVPLEGPILYVLFPDDRLYGGDLRRVFHHSYVSRGIDLKAAGIAYFVNGQLMNVSNESGHYKPTFAEMQDALKWFITQTGHKPFIFEDHSEQNVEEEFNGIHFYEAQLDEAEFISVRQIKNDQLPFVLSEMWNSAIGQHLTFSTVPDTDSDGYVLVESDCYTSAEQDLRMNVLTHSEPLSILEFPRLLALTCLRNMNSNRAISRFNCSKVAIRRTM